MLQCVAKIEKKLLSKTGVAEIGGRKNRCGQNLDDTVFNLKQLEDVLSKNHE